MISLQVAAAPIKGLASPWTAGRPRVRGGLDLFHRLPDDAWRPSNLLWHGLQNAFATKLKK